MKVTGIAVYTDNTHRLITLDVPRARSVVGACTRYRRQCREFAGLLISPGFRWVGNSSDSQAQALAKWERGQSYFDLRPLRDNLIVIKG